MNQDCDHAAAAAFLRALAHPMRLRILCRLLEGELSVSGFESELGLRQPNLSQQLAALRDAALVETRREAKSIVYRLASGRVPILLGALREAFGERGAAPLSSPTPAALGRRAAGPPASALPGGECGVFAITGIAG